MTDDLYENVIKLFGTTPPQPQPLQDVAAMEEVLRGSPLFGSTTSDNGGLEVAAFGIANQIVDEFTNPTKARRCSLNPEERALVIAFALALGWRPDDNKCPPNPFESLCDSLGLDATASIEICPKDRRSLPDVLCGREQPGVQSPFVDVYCVVKGQDTDASTSEISELLVVGRGVGSTREMIQDIAFGAALSLDGRGLVVDGLLHLMANEGNRIEGLIGRRLPGFLAGETAFRQRAIDLAWSELRSQAERSSLVRVHRVSQANQMSLRTRIRTLKDSDIAKGCLLAPQGDSPAEVAVAVPLPVRGADVAPMIPVPKLVVESQFFDETVGPLEECLLNRLEYEAKSRVRFWRTELDHDRGKLEDFAARVHNLLPSMTGSTWAGQSECGGLRATFEASLDAIGNGESVADSDVEGFQTLVRHIESFCDYILGENAGRHAKLRTDAQETKRLLEEESLCTYRVHEGMIPKRIRLGKPEPIKGREFIARNIPIAIKKDLVWIERAKELLEAIVKAKNADGLRRWTASVVLDLTLRGLALDFGGKSGAGFARFAAAVRPLLLLLLGRAMASVRASATDISSSNLVYQCLDDGPTCTLVPTYFYDARNASLSAAAAGRVAILRDRFMACPGNEAEPVERGRLVGWLQRWLTSRRTPKAIQPAEAHELERQIAVALGRDPFGTLATLMGCQPIEDATDPLGDATALTALNTASALLLSGAPEAALLFLAHLIRDAYLGKEPFSDRHPHNQIPELPWQCLLTILGYQVLRNETPPAWSVYGREPTLGTLVGTWFERPEGSEVQLASGDALPADKRLRKLIEECGRLCERWKPGFLGAMIRGRGGTSERLMALQRLLNDEVAEAERQGIRDPEAIRKAWLRSEGERARVAVPALICLEKAVQTWAADGLDDAVLRQRAAELLAPVFLFSPLHADRASELLDILFEAEASAKPTHRRGKWS